MSIRNVVTSRVKAVLKAIVYGEPKLILVGSESSDVIADMKRTEELQTANQLKQLQQAFYHYGAKISDMSENLVQLTTAIEILQNDLDNSKKSCATEVKTIPNQEKIDMMLRVGQAWQNKSSGSKKGMIQ